MGVKRIEGISIYQCDKCGKIYTDKYMAEICCKEYFCEKCGKLAPKYHLLCDECSAKKDYEEAEKLTYDEYIKKYPNHMICYNGECYYEMEDLIDKLQQDEVALEDFPEYCYGTEEEIIEIDIDSAIEDAEYAMDDSYFDWEGIAKLREFINQWNKDYGYKSYFETKKIIVFIPKPTEEEYNERYK